MTTKRVAKRKLSNITFEQENNHVALTCKDQDYSANGHPYALVMKSADFSRESILKMQQVRVTLELPEFLQKFFGLYYTDSQVLAKMLGYVEPEDDSTETEDYYSKYIQDQVDSFEILKSAHDMEDVTNLLSTLDEVQFLGLMKDQASIEKAFEQFEENEKNSAKDEVQVTAPEANEGSTKAVTKKVKKLDEKQTKVDPSETINKGNKMDELQELQKALDSQKTELTKALETIELFKAEKKEALNKARFELVKNAVKDEAKAKVLFKALSLLEAEDEFTAVVKTLADMTEAVEKSALFQETGKTTTTEQEEVKESAIAKALKKSLKQ